MTYDALHPSEISADFRREVTRGEGDEAREWLEALPREAARWLARWGLRRDGAVMHGYCGIVLPVLRGETPLALKLTRMDPWTAHETHALRLWKGEGAVRLLDSDAAAGVLLLERLDASTDLTTPPIEEALDVAAGLLRRLHVPAAPELGLPGFDVELDDIVDEVEAGLSGGGDAPVARQLSAGVVEWAREMRGRGWSRVVNTDGHYLNVLAADREPWLTIDPKVTVGPIGYALAPLLWNRTEEIEAGPGIAAAFDRLVDRVGADPEVARWSVLARCVSYCWWTARVGAPRPPDVARRIVAELS